MRILNS